MDRELMRIAARLYTEAAERMLVAKQLLDNQGFDVCGDDDRNEVLLCEPKGYGTIEELAEVLGESAAKYHENDNDEWWGFVHDGIKYYVIRGKKNGKG